MRLKLSILFLVITFFTLSCNRPKQAVQVEKGVIDLTEWHFDTDGNVKLKGEWNFYWNQLHTPKDFKYKTLQPDTLVEIPGKWNGLKINNEVLKAKGYATYTAKLITNQSTKKLAIRIKSQSSSYKLFLNEDLILQNGVVANNEKDCYANNTAKLAFFEIDKPENNLILQIANFDQRSGGATQPILLGTQNNILRFRDFWFGRNMIFAGIMLILFIYHLGLFIFRKHDLASLYFSIGCFLAFARNLVTGERLLLQMFPGFDWEINRIIAYFTFFWFIPIFLYFLDQLFPKTSFRLINRAFLILAVIFSIFVLLTNPFLYSHTIPYYQLIYSISIFYMLFIVIKAIALKHKGAIYVLIGISILLITLINDLLYQNDIIKTGNWISVGFLFFIIIHAFVLSMKVFSVEKQKAHLEASFNTVHLLNEIGKKITSQLSVEKIVETIYSNINILMDVEFFNIGIFNNREQSLDFPLGFEKDQKISFTSETLNNKDSIAVQCFKNNTDIFITDFKKEYKNYIPEITGCISKQTPESVIYLPLEIKEKKLGVITIQSFRKHAYNDYQQNLFRSIASYAAIAMNNADALKEIENQKKEIETQSEELKTTNDKLVELDKFKKAMTGMIVHDLKNPLNTIIGIAQDNKVKQSGKQMLNMVMNILDVQKFEDTSVKLQINNHSLHTISYSALEQVRFLHEEKDIDIHNSISNQYVLIDKESIERVFINILTNAIKYTPNNGNILIKSYDTGNNFIKTEISDTGIGIPQDKIDLIFNKYEQFGAKNSGVIKSSGIGLTYCKMVIEAHGGKIGVKSEQKDLQSGKAGGTTFWFTLPVGQIQVNEINTAEEIKEKLVITDADKKILNPFLLDLQKHEVYELTNVEDILSQINPGKSETLKKWKIEMENAVYAMNEEKYEKLITMINK